MSKPPEILKVAGPFLLGYLLNYGLYGVLTVQVYVYYNAFPNDRTAVKAIVYGVYLVETMQTIMITWEAFQNFVFGFGKMEALDAINLNWFVCCLIDGAVAFVVQTYFAYRIHLLSRSKLLARVIVLMSLAQFGGAIATSTLAKIIGMFSKLQHRTSVAVSIGFIFFPFWLGGSAACDIVIAVSMTYVLSRYDREFQETRDIVRRIIRLTMETGSLTATVATVELILFLGFTAKPYHITAALILAKIYSNSMMVIFNTRVEIAGGRGQLALSEQVITDSEGQFIMDRQKEMNLQTRVGRGHQHGLEPVKVGVSREIEIRVS
ncbi:hypothetical protein L218DRAFT_1067158 [Marasmius fiardii PR-910]|nr:hypothetical protein L218DRAFT_1067158 [Marasmius fiardii PR-910]